MSPSTFFLSMGHSATFHAKQYCVRSVTAINAAIKFHTKVIKYTLQIVTNDAIEKGTGHKVGECSALMYVNIAVAVADEKECRDLVTLNR